MRNYKKFIEGKSKMYSVVVTESEFKRLRNKYDKKYTKKINRLQLADLKNGDAMLDGLSLKLGEWL